MFISTSHRETTFFVILLRIYFIKYIIASSYLTSNRNSIIFMSQILLLLSHIPVIIKHVTELLNKYNYL